MKHKVIQDQARQSHTHTCSLIFIIRVTVMPPGYRSHGRNKRSEEILSEPDAAPLQKQRHKVKKL